MQAVQGLTELGKGIFQNLFNMLYSLIFNETYQDTITKITEQTTLQDIAVIGITILAVIVIGGTISIAIKIFK